LRIHAFPVCHGPHAYFPAHFPLNIIFWEQMHIMRELFIFENVPTSVRLQISRRKEREGENGRLEGEIERQRRENKKRASD